MGFTRAPHCDPLCITCMLFILRWSSIIWCVVCVVGWLMILFVDDVLMMFDVLLNYWSIGPLSNQHLQHFIINPWPGIPQAGISDQKLRISDQTYLGRKSWPFCFAERRGYPLEMGVLMAWSINNRVCSWESLWMGYVNVYDAYLLQILHPQFAWRITHGQVDDLATRPGHGIHGYVGSDGSLPSQRSGMGLPSQHS